MASPVTGTFDTSGWTEGLANLSEIVKNQVARSMAVAGGKVLRDEVLARVPVGTAAGGSITPGLLKSAIYLAYKEARSTGGEQVYAVSWNAEKAPHGHLVEFGHWQTHVTYIGKDGEWHTDKSKPLANPRFVPAQPFLRPALEAVPRAQQAMIERGRERLAELLANPASGDDAA